MIIPKRVYGEPEEWLAKEHLAQLLRHVIVERGISQYAAAKMIGIDQPKVSAIIKGRLAHFSSERLMRFLIKLGHDVDITVKPKPRNRSQGRLRVVSALDD
jgi:predicted XRE-type DNA-binding protein